MLSKLLLLLILNPFFHWNLPTLYLQQVKKRCYISSVVRQFFFLPKQSQKSRSVSQDRSRSLGKFRKGKTGLIAKFRRTDLFTCSISREMKTSSYSKINMVCETSIVFKTALQEQCNLDQHCFSCEIHPLELNCIQKRKNTSSMILGL